MVKEGVRQASLQKKIGLSLLLVPVVFLTFFGVGEMIEKIPGGFIHFVQLLPLVILLIVAYYNSEWAGYLLIIIGSILGILYIIISRFPLPTVLLVESIVFIMPVISGILLLKSTRKI